MNKTVYVFSADQEQGKVAHANFVSTYAKSQGIDGREWADVIANILGGKVFICLTAKITI